jgi:hypothetical protein
MYRWRYQNLPDLTRDPERRSDLLGGVSREQGRLPGLARHPRRERMTQTPSAAAS